MSRKRTALTRAARRELGASFATWRVYWAQISAGVELHRQNLLVTSKRRARQGDPSVAPQYRRFLPAKVRTLVTRAAEQPAVTRHGITVRPTSEGKFIASCACGGWSSRPLTERGAKGQGTRHLNTATDAATVAAA